MHRLLAVLILATSACAGLPQKSDGCVAVNDLEAPASFRVYSCPHGFLVPSSDGKTSARYVSGVTNCVDRTVYFYETRPEIRFHEYRHAAACAVGGGQH